MSECFIYLFFDFIVDLDCAPCLQPHTISLMFFGALAAGVTAYSIYHFGIGASVMTVAKSAIAVVNPSFAAGMVVGSILYSFL